MLHLFPQQVVTSTTLPLLVWIQIAVGVVFLLSAVLAFLGIDRVLAWGALVLGLGVQWAVWDFLGWLGVLGRSFNGRGVQSGAALGVLALIAIGVLFVVLGLLQVSSTRQPQEVNSEGYAGQQSVPFPNVGGFYNEPSREEPTPQNLPDAVVQAFARMGFGLVRDRAEAPSYQKARAAWRAKASVYHPDKMAGRSREDQAQATREFQELNEAWGVLEGFYAEGNTTTSSTQIKSVRT